MNAWFYKAYWNDERLFLQFLRRKLPVLPGGGSVITSLTTTGTSGASTVIGGVLNIPIYTGTFTSLTTTGTSGVATLVAGVLNVPNYSPTFTSLTTTGTSGASTLIAGVLNVPTYTTTFVSLTTTGTSGAATLTAGVLNVPNYGSGSVPTTRTITTTTPITIGGGASADLSADRTIAWDFSVASTWTGIQSYTNGLKAAGGVVLNAGTTQSNSLLLSVGGFIQTTNGVAATGNQSAISFGMLTAANHTSNAVHNVLVTGNFTPTSGSGTFNSMTFAHTINQTGGASGITRAIYIVPTLTAVADFRAIEITSGKLLLAAGATARAPLNFPTGSAPSSPVDGDVWREDNTNTGFKIRVNGVTKTITLA